ncbi:hypothetical protein SISNIDRAFT_447342 [Sistotremastrum niveocremeum HHB9708]|uniref:Beta-glucuronidase C-terminal domain-containing protein n=1 Tax=Sistotremastrum niveocremeum HHB9708 TaxID=1314777 RepID=A0A164MMJ4_9AGAM|nr:hypothetical protein SISNIDRAFT_447342 [Sistotremastrum niveocremeum HHB9708]
MLSPLYITVFSFLLSLPFVSAVTLYTIPGPAATGTANPAFQTAICIGAVPCDGSQLTPTPNPGNITTAINIQLTDGGYPGLGIPVSGNFLGFSIELSVANQLFGNTGTQLNPIFLNLLANIETRAGRILIRVGGNSQESATIIPGGLPNGTAVEKITFSSDKTATPTLLLSPNLIYAMGNISNLVNVQWFLGVPFNDTSNPRTTLAEIAQHVLGDRLVGLQLGNEPDLYTINGLRPPTYTPDQFTADWGTVLQDYSSDSKVLNSSMFVGPSVCCGLDTGWTPEDVWNTGFLTDYADQLAWISVEHYPTNNCNDTGILDPEVLMPQLYMNHSAVVQLSAPYLNTSQIALTLNKPFIMFETNTASCGGFSGLSDSFISAMWAVDYALSMASFNFTNALLHVGGQSDYYNPFTPPTTNQSSYRQWSIGPTFYSTLVIAESLGSSNLSQVVDLQLNSNNDLTPGYAIYEQGTAQRVVLFNYLTDPSGASDYTAYISVGGNETGQANSTPASISVKLLLAPSATDKWNTTWAGQTFGGPFASDGRITGSEQIIEITCDQPNNVCAVQVPAPAVAVVFLSQSSLQESQGTATATFQTTVATGTINTVSIDPSVLATSNGRGGQSFLGLGSTSPGSSDGLKITPYNALIACFLIMFFNALTLLSR